MRILPITLQKRIQSGRWSLEQAAGIEPPPSPERGGLAITLEGREFSSLMAACKHYSIDKRIIDMRINRMGWSLEEAFILKPRGGFVVDGVKYSSLLEACRRHGLHDKLVESRLRLGWTTEQAFGLEPPPSRQKKRPSSRRAGEIIYGGQNFKNSTDLAKAYGLKASTLSYRLRKKWTLAEAVGDEPPPERNPRMEVFEINGQRYLGVEAVCAAFGVDVSNFRYRKKAGWTVRQALDLEPPPPQSSVAYIVTRPTGEEVYVTDFAAFAKREELPSGGRALRTIAYVENVHHWRGWKCRKV